MIAAYDSQQVKESKWSQPSKIAHMHYVDLAAQSPLQLPQYVIYMILFFVCLGLYISQCFSIILMSFYVAICLTVAAVKKDEKRVRLKYIVKVAGVCLCLYTSVYSVRVCHSLHSDLVASPVSLCKEGTITDKVENIAVVQSSGVYMC